MASIQLQSLVLLFVVLRTILRNRMLLSARTNRFDLLPDSYVFNFLLCLCESRQKTNYFAFILNDCGQINVAFQSRTLTLIKYIYFVYI